MKRHLIEGIKLHRFHILAVHPFEFLYVKYRRRFAHMMEVEHFHQFLKAENLLIILWAPSEGYIVDYCLRDKSLLN